MSCPLLVDGTQAITRANETSESAVEKPCINARDNWMEEKKQGKMPI